MLLSSVRVTSRAGSSAAALPSPLPISMQALGFLLSCGREGLALGRPYGAQEAWGAPPVAGPSLSLAGHASVAALLCISKCSKSHLNGKFTERFSALLCWYELSLIQ